MKTNFRFYKTSVYISAYNWTSESWTTEHFDKINWLPIDQRFNKCLSTRFFKFFSEMCPQYTNAIYKTTNQNNTVTRNSPIKFFLPLRTNSRADDNLKTLIIVQIFNKEDFFLVFLWMYSLCIIVFETSTFFHNRKWWRHFMNNWWNLGYFLESPQIWTGYRMRLNDHSL